MRTLIVGLAAVFLGAILALAAEDDWRVRERAFESAWEIGGAGNPNLRARLRAKKRKALAALEGCRDGRAVPMLLSAHKAQDRFVAGLQRQYDDRKAAHDKLAPVMEKSLQGKKPRPDGTILVTPAERAWLDEKNLLEQLQTEIIDEDRIAGAIRKVVREVLGAVEGTERQVALRAVLKEAGRGQSETDREFVRLLGYVDDDEVEAALRRYAEGTDPFVVQAALEALGRQNRPESIALLLARLDDPRWQIRAAALVGLAFFKSPHVVDALLAHGATEDGVMRRHYLTALARMVGLPAAELPATLAAWRTWWPKNRARILEAWRTNTKPGPVEEDLPVVRLDASQGSTSFYGITTDSRHIVFVIDVSGSMGEHGGTDEHGNLRIDLVKRELTQAIRSLGAEGRGVGDHATFNIVTYAADVRVYEQGRMVVATKANREKALKWVQGLEAVGATNIYDALETAFSIVATRRAAKQLDQGPDTIFLMTDGQPNRGKIIDPILIREAIRTMNRERKITIHTIGVGSDHDRTFLENLAAENHGQYLPR